MKIKKVVLFEISSDLEDEYQTIDLLDSLQIGVTKIEIPADKTQLIALIVDKYNQQHHEAHDRHAFGLMVRSATKVMIEKLPSYIKTPIKTNTLESDLIKKELKELEGIDILVYPLSQEKLVRKFALRVIDKKFKIRPTPEGIEVSINNNKNKEETIEDYIKVVLEYGKAYITKQTCCCSYVRSRVRIYNLSQLVRFQVKEDRLGCSIIDPDFVNPSIIP